MKKIIIATIASIAVGCGGFEAPSEDLDEAHGCDAGVVETQIADAGFAFWDSGQPCPALCKLMCGDKNDPECDGACIMDCEASRSR